jgi:hypothetical protein
MLQFLQYKVFGRHKVPEGWVIVTAGNPPEYNKSVREFDVVTLDRLKVLEVEADYQTWKKYASERGIHNAILNFLEIKKDYFYHIEMTVKGRSYVTARGWEDLSQIIKLYEEESLAVDETLVGQYIRNDRIVKEFTAYYDLYNKYKKDYQLDAILAGNASDEAKMRGANATFDERLSVLGMLIDRIQSEIKDIVLTSDYLTALMEPLKAVKLASETKDAGALVELLSMQEQGRKTLIDNLSRANSLSEQDKKKHRRVMEFLHDAGRAVVSAKAEQTATGADAFALIKERFDAEVSQMKRDTEAESARLHNLFAYVEETFEQGNELLILVTELTVNSYSARYISQFGCADYQKASSELMLTERQQDIQKEIRALEL